MHNLQSNQLPFVSLVIPCRNEGNYISSCLESLLAQQYPNDYREILVVDGMSSDNTREIVQRHALTNTSIRLIDNEKKVTPSAFNRGVEVAQGEVILLIGAHASYPPTYVESCVQHLLESGADVVGGNLITKTKSDTAQAQAIALVLTHSFGVGGSRFRQGVSTPQYVDAVFGGCYRKSLFDEVGLFNENLTRSQDMEFFVRLKRAGKKILLVPDIECTYYPKATLKEFFLHNIQDGIWAIYPLKFVRVPLRIRHYIPLSFIAGLATLGVAGLLFPFWGTIFWSTLIFYAIIVILISLEIAGEKRDLTLVPALAAAFAARHFGYGTGSLIGAGKLLLPKR